MTNRLTVADAPRTEDVAYDPKTMLDERQERYLDWLLTAPKDREPSSKQKLADELGVNVRTMSGWEEKRAFKERLEA